MADVRPEAIVAAPLTRPRHDTLTEPAQLFWKATQQLCRRESLQLGLMTDTHPAAVAPPLGVLGTQAPDEQVWPVEQVPQEPLPQELGPQLRPAQVQVGVDDTQRPPEQL